MKFETVKGMRDFLPEQAKKKQFIEDTCRRVFERYGFEPLQTPVVEDFALLSAKGSGGEAIKDEIYYFKDKGDRELGLRYDVTVPLARVCATNPQLPKPFKRYCIGPVYRYNRPQAKRYREFTQADIDVVGVKSVLADFECLAASADILKALGLEFTIKVNNRVVLEGIAKNCGIREGQIAEAFRIIDKIGKINEKEARKEMLAKGIDDKILAKIFLNSLEDTKSVLGKNEGLDDLAQLLTLAEENGLSEVKFDLGLCRGLEYYTGNVFEIALNEGPSVGGGGRYDNLIQLYGGPPAPAVGISLGIDRLFDALEKTLFIGPNSDVFIIPLSKEAAKEGVRLAFALRKLGVAVEMNLMERGIGKNMEYANKKGIAFTIVLGEKELAEKKFKLKDMGSGEEKEFGLGDAKGVALLLKKG